MGTAGQRPYVHALGPAAEAARLQKGARPDAADRWPEVLVEVEGAVGVAIRAAVPVVGLVVRRGQAGVADISYARSRVRATGCYTTGRRADWSPAQRTTL